MSLEEKNTAVCIKNCVIDILSKHEANRVSYVFVTDNAANMKAAFHDDTWIGCSCHNLNLILPNGLQKLSKPQDHPETELPDEVVDLINSCNELVTLAKQTKLNGQLETTLKQCVVTRWNSVLTPGANRTLMRLLTEINEELLVNVVQVLQPFDNATKHLSADKSATVHLVVATTYQLTKVLSVLGTDSQVVEQLKRHLLAKLEHHFTITQFHLSACLLDPRQKSNMQLMKQDERIAAINTLKQIVAAVKLIAVPVDSVEGAHSMGSSDMVVEVDAQPTTNSHELEVGQPKKRQCIEKEKHDFFDDLFQQAASSSSADAVQDEVAEYIYSLSISKAGNEILKYWHEKREQWPKLVTVARKVLCAPASSTSSERVFSFTGRTLEDRRCS